MISKDYLLDLVDNSFYVKISVLNKIIRGNHGEYE